MTHPPHNPALQAAVVADAESDTPRLVYADWLDENGDPDRAEYIRTGIGLARSSPAADDWLDLQLRHTEARESLHLRQDLGPALAPEFICSPNLAWDEDSPPYFRRGFPYRALLPRADGPPSAGACCERVAEVVGTTTIRRLDRGLDLDPALFAAVLRAPLAAGLTGVGTGSGTPSGSAGPLLGALIDSPAAASIRLLDYGLPIAARADLDALTAARFPNLDEFAGFSNTATAAGLVRLIAAGWFGRLRRVTFRGGGAAGAGLAALAGLPGLHALEFWYPSPEDLAGVAGGRGYRALARLSLHGIRPDAGPLAGADLPALRELDLEAAPATEVDLAALTRADWFGRLRMLRLDAKTVGSTGAKLLGGSPAARSLQVLSLRAPVGKGGLAALLRPGAFPELVSLRLDGFDRRVTPADVAGLLARAEFSHLRHLDLGLPLDDAGVAAIAANPSFSRLTALRLADARSETRFGAAGFRAVAESPYLRYLHFGRYVHPPDLGGVGPDRAHLVPPAFWGR